MNWRPRSSTISGASRGASATETEYMELVDDAGSVIASFSQDTVGNVELEVDSSPLMRMTTTRVATNVGTKQALLPAVPTGKVRIVTQVVARNASADLSASSDSMLFGFNAGCDNWGQRALTGLVSDSLISSTLGNGDAGIGGTSSKGTAGSIFGAIAQDTAITATLDIDVHYYDVDA